MRLPDVFVAQCKADFNAHALMERWILSSGMPHDLPFDVSHLVATCPLLRAVHVVGVYARAFVEGEGKGRYPRMAPTASFYTPRSPAQGMTYCIAERGQQNRTRVTGDALVPF